MVSVILLQSFMILIYAVHNAVKCSLHSLRKKLPVIFQLLNVRWILIFCREMWANYFDEHGITAVFWSAAAELSRLKEVLLFQIIDLSLCLLSHKSV